MFVRALVYCKVYSNRYLHMRALISLIIYIVAPASAGRESFRVPSNRGSASPSPSLV
jgi:hypothetical protein